jgi:hypothetical protein
MGRSKREDQALLQAKKKKGKKTCREIKEKMEKSKYNKRSQQNKENNRQKHIMQMSATKRNPIACWPKIDEKVVLEAHCRGGA